MRKLLTTLLAAICLASTSARAAPFTVQDLLVNGSITFATPLSGTALGSVCVNGSNQVIIGSANCFPSGTGTITGPGSSTVGYVPLWSNVGGTQIGAGLPVTQVGAASSLVETGASGAIAFSSDGVASIVGNGADGLMLNVGAGQAISLVSTGNTGTIGKLSFLAQDSTGTTVDYGDLIASVVSNTHGATVGALDMPVLATGSTTPRNLSEWESDLTNVKAFGAKLNGTTNDSASLTSARAQITTNGRVLIPNGNILASDTVTIPSGSEAIWDMNAQPTTGWNSYLPGFGTDIIHTENGGEWWYQRATSATAGQGTAPIIRLDRQMTHTGGGGWAMMQLNDVIAATANPGGQTTSLNVNTTSNETASGEESPMVGIYQNMIRNSGSATPGYGMNISFKDLTGAAQNIATIGVESDLIANGTWSNYQAGNFDLVLKKGLSASPIFQANFGVRVGNWEADLTQGGYQEPYWIGATNVYQCGFCGIATLAAGVPFFDASQATYTDANGIAVRLGSGNAIDFAGDGSHKLYLAAGPELAYSKNGSLLFGVEDAGKLDAAGIVNAFANGTPILETTSAANTGTVGKLSFLAQDSTGATVDYGDLIASVVSNTHGATVGALDMPVLATAGTTPLLTSQLAQALLSPESFGAKGDCTTDDSAAFNAQAAYIRASTGYQAQRTIYLQPNKCYKVTTSINWGGFTPYGVTVEGNGSTIVGAVGATHAIVNGVDSRLTIRDLRIVSAGSALYGIQVGQNGVAGSDTPVNLTNVYILGSFVNAAYLNRAAEDSSGFGDTFNNQTSTGFAYIADGMAHWSFDNTYQADNVTPNTQLSNNSITCYSCIFANSTGAGAKAGVVWLGNFSNHRFINCYANLGSGTGPIVVIYSAFPPTTITNSGLDWDVHDENAPTQEFLITGTYATPVIPNLTYADHVDQAAASTSIFNLDTGITSLSLPGLRLTIGKELNTGVTVFDQPSKYSGSIDATLPASNLTWNAAAGTFPGCTTVAGSPRICGTTNFNTNVSVTGSVIANSYSQLGLDAANGSLLLGNVAGGSTTTPHIDFYGDSVASNYSVQLIADAAGQLTVKTASGSSDGTLNAFTGKIVGGNVQVQQLQGAGGSPTVTGCGSGAALDAGATNLAGTITEGTSATGCVITFATTPKPFTAAPHCVISSPNGAPFTSYSTSTTALTIVNASASGNEYTYICAQ